MEEDIITRLARIEYETVKNNPVALQALYHEGTNLYNLKETISSNLVKCKWNLKKKIQEYIKIVPESKKLTAKNQEKLESSLLSIEGEMARPMADTVAKYEGKTTSYFSSYLEAIAEIDQLYQNYQDTKEKS